MHVLRVGAGSEVSLKLQTGEDDRLPMVNRGHWSHGGGCRRCPLAEGVESLAAWREAACCAEGAELRSGLPPGARPRAVHRERSFAQAFIRNEEWLRPSGLASVQQLRRLTWKTEKGVIGRHRN